MNLSSIGTLIQVRLRSSHLSLLPNGVDGVWTGGRTRRLTVRVIALQPNTIVLPAPLRSYHLVPLAAAGVGGAVLQTPSIVRGLALRDPGRRLI